MEFSIDFNKKLNEFFAPPPAKGAGPGDIRSVLFLLRRDLRDLSLPEGSEADAKAANIAPVLASAGLMIGFELLARIWIGENDPGQKALIQAFKEILGVDANVADLMVNFRNAIAHGYQLEIFARGGKKYRFALGDHAGSNLWFEERNNGTEVEYHLNFWELRRRFLDAVAKVEGVLRDPAQTEKHKNFYKMIPYIKPYHMI